MLYALWIDASVSFNPIIQERYLFICVKPVLTAIHNSQSGVYYCIHFSTIWFIIQRAGAAPTLGEVFKALVDLLQE